MNDRLAPESDRIYTNRYEEGAELIEAILARAPEAADVVILEHWLQN